MHGYDEEWSTKIVNFMNPGIEGSCAKVWSYKLYSEKTLFLYSQVQIRQTEGIVMMSKEGSTNILNFMTPTTGILVLGCCQISHIMKMHYFCKNYLLFTLA